MLDQLGPAVISNTQIFLYGSTGNGKTSIAERLVRVYRDAVYIPYAIEVHGQIINVFDSVVHSPASGGADSDSRWVRCQRPCIAVGGEMVQEMLELRSTSERLNRLRAMLNIAVTGYEERARIHELAKSNGHGGRKIEMHDE